MPKFTSYAEGTPNWIELTTDDLRAGADFYAALFGWDLEENPIGDGQVYVIARKDGERVAGLGGQMPGMADHPPFWSVYLAVDDVDATTAKVEPAGGTVEAGPFDVMSHGRMSSVKDPTGARVNLWQANENIGTGLANEPGTPIWNEVVTGDIDRAVEFYGAVLGITAQEFEMGGEKYISLNNAAGSMIGGAVPPPDEHVPPHWNVYFNVADADATGARIVELGGRNLAPNFDMPGVGRMGFYTDPQGGNFALMETKSAE